MNVRVLIKEVEIESQGIIIIRPEIFSKPNRSLRPVRFWDHKEKDKTALFSTKNPGSEIRGFILYSDVIFHHHHRLHHRKHHRCSPLLLRHRSCRLHLQSFRFLRNRLQIQNHPPVKALLISF